MFRRLVVVVGWVGLLFGGLVVAGWMWSHLPGDPHACDCHGYQEAIERYPWAPQAEMTSVTVSREYFENSDPELVGARLRFELHDPRTAADDLMSRLESAGFERGDLPGSAIEMRKDPYTVYLRADADWPRLSVSIIGPPDAGAFETAFLPTVSGQ